MILTSKEKQADDKATVIGNFSLKFFFWLFAVTISDINVREIQFRALIANLS